MKEYLELIKSCNNFDQLVKPNGLIIGPMIINSI